MKEPMQKDLENKRMGRHEVTERGENFEKPTKMERMGRKENFTEKREINSWRQNTVSDGMF